MRHTFCFPVDIAFAVPALASMLLASRSPRAHTAGKYCAFPRTKCGELCTCHCLGVTRDCKMSKFRVKPMRIGQHGCRVTIGSRALNVSLQQLIVSYAAHKGRQAHGKSSLGDDHSHSADMPSAPEADRVDRELLSKRMQLKVLKNRSIELTKKSEAMTAAAAASQSTIDAYTQQETALTETCASQQQHSISFHITAAPSLCSHNILC